jgi:hypothetical protein
MLRIAQDPGSSPYVRELSIGPKDVPWFGQLNFDDSREARQLKYWDEVVEETGAFEATDRAVPMLQTAFSSFTNLQHVRIDSESTKESTDEKPARTWGFRDDFRTDGPCGHIWVFAENVPNLLMNEDGLCKYYGHYDRVL